MLDPRFVFLGAAINLIGSLKYLVATLKGEAKPNRVTFFLWALAPLIAFAAQLDEGVGLASVMTFVVGFSPLLIFIASFFNKKAYWELHRFDYFFGGLALLGLVLWLVTEEGLYAIAFGILADGLAAVPTLAKSFTNPETEVGMTYWLAGVNAVITLLTIEVFNLAHLGFPVYILLINIVLGSLISFKLGPRYFKPHVKIVRELEQR